MDKPAGTSTTLLRALIAMTIGAAGVLMLLPPAAPPAAPAPAPKPAAPDFRLPDPIVYNRDIRPILSDTCFKCHGPASSTRKADLRLDTVEGFSTVVAAGKPADSELFRRVSATDDDRMPPASSGKTLTPREIALVKQWIEKGATVQPHWAFLPPERPEVPKVRKADWPRNEIDRFVLARLESEKLAPSPEARRETLLRRVSLDLTGLPPTSEELDAFLADASSEAYEKAVDRLLASPRYGEHRARYWLDQSRYGDTHGLHLDNYREMWPYRDWVIRAYNENAPFDRFLIEQVAGDLLPEPTLDQLVATGFNRCHVTTGEGGSIEEEVYVRNVVERVDAAGLILMGLSLGCARCHDHKYDPLTQKDYYQLFAFFNSLDGPSLDGNVKDTAPSAKVPTSEQAAQLAGLRAEIRKADERLGAPNPELDAAQAAWEQARRAELAGGWIALDPTSLASAGGAVLAEQPDFSILASGPNPDRDDVLVTVRTDLTGIRALRLDAMTDPSLPKGSGPGRASNGHFVLSELEAEGARFVSAAADYSARQYPIAAAIDGKEGTGWAVDARLEPRTAIFVPEAPLHGPELKLKLRFRHGDGHALGRFRLLATTQERAAVEAKPSVLGPWKSVFFAHGDGQEALAKDFGPEADPAKAVWADAVYADGAVHKFSEKIGANYLTRTITTVYPRVMHVALGSGDGMKLWLNGRHVHENPARRGAKADQDFVVLDLAPGENRLLLKVANFGGPSDFYFKVQGESFGPLPPDVAQIVAAASRSEAQAARVRAFWRRGHWPEYAALEARLIEERRKETALDASLPSTLIYRETAQPREAFILKRGEYTLREAKVQRETPAALPPMAPELPRNRLGLARWLTDPKHPLTARVAVNRLWQQFFGTGLVKTSGDLGGQGEAPSHPELLDWLSVQFLDDGWDVKATLRRIVLSATYRQSARVSPASAQRDPENRLLARGPRFRLDAEVLRDQALLASGLLVEQVGGPSVKPPQPDLWVAVGFVGSNTQKFTADAGHQKVHRRSLYTFWKRTAPAPQMGTFDAPSRESCTVRRERTNTPLQALLLMNDPQYVEAARALAERTMREGGPTPESRAAWIFKRAAARPAGEKELEILLGAWRDHRAVYAADPKAAAALIAVGGTAADQALDPVELASWTMIANLLLNLDEVLTKG